MRNIALVLACLAFAGHGRRVQPSIEQLPTGRLATSKQVVVEAAPLSGSGGAGSSWQEGANEAYRPLNSLLSLLLSLTPQAAFNAFAHGARHPSFGSHANPVSSRAGPSAISMSDVLVMDGSGSFVGSRAIFQTLHDFGDFSNVTAFSSSGAETKKILLSRDARYSGLWDKLEFAEGENAELGTALGKVGMWIVINADESKLPDQISEASKAGVKRAFIHISASESSAMDTTKVKGALDATSMDYTLMRTGSMVKAGMGGGLLVSELDEPTCDEIPTEDVYRFITEAMTIDEAKGRAFSLCTSANSDQLKKMRLAGRSRREEVEALLRGEIKAVDESANETAVVEEKKDPVQEEKERSDEIQKLREKALEKVKLQAEEKARKAAEEKQKQDELEAKRKEALKKKDGGDDKEKKDTKEEGKKEEKKDGDKK